jgi:hypothetical protein
VSKKQVREINIPAKPSAGSIQAKPQDERDSTREGSKPKANNNVEAATETKGAHRKAVILQARDTKRAWFKPTV